ncbi:MAG: hypothetical protein JWQ52_2170 [Phenylobacterium sp.]|jgi:hypothetical protein|nr:hypothetical protein [Phenylobacterium sp.]
MQTLELFAQPARLGRDIGDVGLKLGHPLAQIEVFALQVLGRGHRDRPSRAPTRLKTRGKTMAASTQSAEAAKSGDMEVSNGRRIGRIDRFGGGTRPTAHVPHMGTLRRSASAGVHMAPL